MPPVCTALRLSSSSSSSGGAGPASKPPPDTAFLARGRAPARSSERRRLWFCAAGALFGGRPGESSLTAVEESTDRRRVRLLTSSAEGSEPSAVLHEHARRDG